MQPVRRDCIRAESIGHEQAAQTIERNLRVVVRDRDLSAAAVQRRVGAFANEAATVKDGLNAFTGRGGRQTPARLTTNARKAGSNSRTCPITQRSTQGPLPSVSL